jgi:hypothetical protein
MVAETYLVKRIETLQEELEFLKRTLLKKGGDCPVRLSGIWKGVDFSDEEIDEARNIWIGE